MKLPASRILDGIVPVLPVQFQIHLFSGWF